jgi:hypothetical protein
MGAVVILAAASSAMLSCSRPCRALCNEWYDYLVEVCEQEVLVEDRVRCIDDHRRADNLLNRSPDDDRERAACEEGHLGLNSLTSASDELTKRACCEYTEAMSCPQCIDQPHLCIPAPSPEPSPSPAVTP